MSFLGGGLGQPSDTGPDVSPVTTPDQKALGKSRAQGEIEAGWAGHFWAVFFSAVVEGLKIIITALVAVFDEVLSLFVGFVTAAQGTGTQGFFDLTAAILNDLLGVEVAGSELAAAARSRGLIGGMQQTGADFLNVLINEFTGHAPSAAGGPAGLPGVPGETISPEQGLKGAQAFLGFILSFAVRQGNLETISTALPESFRMFDGIRAYGELMAKNLGLGRLSRRVLQPLLQTLVAEPMQEQLNVQYRPKRLDPKQIAAAFIRDTSGNFDYRARLALLGYSEKDIDLLVEDTYARVPANELYLLWSTGQIDDLDFSRRIQALGFSGGDVELIKIARNTEAVQHVDQAFLQEAIRDLTAGLIDTLTFERDVESTLLPRPVKDAIKRNGENRVAGRHRLLSVGFLKKAYLNGSITLDEFLQHAALLNYSQDDIDILEQELLVEQKQAADKIKARAAATAARLAKKTPTSGAPPA